MPRLKAKIDAARSSRERVPCTRCRRESAEYIAIRDFRGGVCAHCRNPRPKKRRACAQCGTAPTSARRRRWLLCAECRESALKSPSTTHTGVLPEVATDALPGSAKKIAVMAYRTLMGQLPNHPEDPSIRATLIERMTHTVALERRSRAPVLAISTIRSGARRGRPSASPSR